LNVFAKYISIKDANAFIEKCHRHHGPVAGGFFAIAAWMDDKIVGVAIVGRPVSRHLDNGDIAEVARCCTDGSKNVCSFLYSRCAAAAKAIGFCKIITYILDSEIGTSLKAAGWINEGSAGGGSWNKKSRPRSDKAPTVPKQRYSVTFANNVSRPIPDEPDVATLYEY